MKHVLAIAGALMLAAAPSLAPAAEVHVDTSRRVVVYDGDRVTVVRRPHNVVVIRDGDADCTVRTVRAWVNGHYVKRRITYCGS